ncbi:hypothetical protein C4D60_Mb04t36820 [Musa balbisiana]|uniref:Uncharacterized protein n=1 Tax=Musa balbisiana TaxID=52838 RepID=A0A4S8KHB7_MUSBA|nr:hypothetical protein C4D60_Mb04t36820 [Musa balbisiana]
METVKNLLRPKPNPQQQLREWQRRLRQECRNIERQIRGTCAEGGEERAEGDQGCREKERHGFGKATARTVGHLSKSAEVMKLVNNLMKAPEVAATMQEFSKEMTKAGVMEEMVNDAVDTALDSEDIEEEIEEEVDKVLAAIAGETMSQLPDAVRKEKMKQPSVSTVGEEREAVAEGAEDEDLDEIRERLARVRS